MKINAHLEQVFLDFLNIFIKPSENRSLGRHASQFKQKGSPGEKFKNVFSFVKKQCSAYQIL